MSLTEAVTGHVWCVDLSGPLRLARETPEDRFELQSGGPERLMRRRLLRAGLAARWSVHADALRFQREATGRVRVTNPRPAFVSAAHREDMVVMAVSDAPIGVDLEPLGSVAATDIEELCPPWPALAPTSRWTAFEALGKLFSIGTAIPMREILTRSVGAETLHLSLAGREVRIALFPCKQRQIAVAEFEM